MTGIRQKMKKNNSRAGFTLVELMVTIAVLGILLGVTITAILGWRDWANFKRQNEYAQTIFTAAQTQLTQYAENGQLDGITSELEENGQLLDLTTITTVDGTKASNAKVWNHSANSFIFQVTAAKADYEAYKQDATSVSADKRIVYDILDDYLYDKSILDASIAVEFDPNEGQVYAVLYSDVDTGFVYDAGNNNTRGVVDISDRTEGTRREKMIGYYGVDTLSKATSTKTEKPVISNLRLNNEDTLNLSWNLSRVTQATAELTYEIIVYNSENRQPIMIITMNNLLGSDGGITRADLGTMNDNLHSTDAEVGEQTIAGKVIYYTYDEHNVAISSSPTYLNFKAAVEANGTVRLVLDAADLEATAEKYLNCQSLDNYAQLKDTFSALRFGIEEQNIYCTVKGSGINYKSTATKQSNVEALLYGSDEQRESAITGEKAYTYELTNARHLYNMRYTEIQPVGDKTSYSYIVSENISWSGEGSVLANGNVYRGQQQVTNAATVFPQIESLRRNATLESVSTQRIYSIDGLILTYEGNGTEYTGTGLFMINYGIIQNAALDEIKVDGTAGGDCTGSFCAYNAGKLQNLTVLGGDVTGLDYVGGIFGKQINLTLPNVTPDQDLLDQLGNLLGRYDGPLSGILQDMFNWIAQEIRDLASNVWRGLHSALASLGVNTTWMEGHENWYTLDVTYEQLKNHAGVSGSNYVGGITGEVKANVRDWNFRTDTDRSHVQELADAAAITAAYTDVASNLNHIYYTTSVTIKDCENYGMVYGSGQNIGGIVGADSNLTADMLMTSLEDIHNITIEDCISVPECDTVDEAIALFESQVNGTLVSDSSNVGGIVGYHDVGTVNNCSTSTISSGYVVGGTYVGGIIGAQSVTAEEQKLNYLLTSSGSVTNGNHVIGKSYVGGIIGYNNGNLVNCVNNGVVAAYDSYAGGITGYNGTDGLIDRCMSAVDYDAEAEQIFTKVGKRADYVGGITGYNTGIMKSDTQTMSINAVASGKNYVGGIIGYNADHAQVSGYELQDGHIFGVNFVGGYAGLNTSVDLLEEKNLSSDPNEVLGSYAVGGIIGGNVVRLNRGITTYFVTDNFLGNVEADGLAGGFIGYNMVYRNVAGSRTPQEYITSILGVMENTDHLQDNTATDYENALKVADCMKDVEEVTKDISRVTLTITSDTDQPAVNRLKQVSAKLYAGGVIGYNAMQSELVIRNIYNNTLITAKASVEADFKTETPGEKYFAYAGGIIGYVSKNVTLDSCRNEDAGMVESEGTYTGGICEVNAGTIRDCIAGNLGRTDTDYVGGLCGLNLADGQITGSYLDASDTIMGADYAGGIASENLGKITDTWASGTMIGSGVNIGGIVAYNGSTGQVEVRREADIQITGTGENVGTIAGYNAGTLLYTGEGEVVAESTFVTGNHNVGGVVGLQAGENMQLSGLTNRGDVTAVNGNAGGIVGYIQAGSMAELRECHNYGEITSTRSGDAGGIAAYCAAGGNIEYCENYGAVNAANGVGGGIIGINEGTLESCKAVHNNLTTTLTIHGMTAVGGIAGQNHGTITDSTVSGITVTNYTSAAGSVGGIAGSNSGTIGWNMPGKKVVNNIIVSGSANRADTGGVAGTNAGSISGDISGSAIIDVTVKYASSSVTNGNLGGVAGRNNGSIAYCTVQGNVTGARGYADYGYGGIAGISGTTREATITGCSYVGNLYADGTASAVANLGGIVGKNGKYGTVAQCHVGEEGTTTSISCGNSNAAFGYTGGMIGWNLGSIISCDNNGQAGNAVVTISGYAGHIGGIVGFEDEGSLLTGSVDMPLTSGNRWTVTARFYSNDCGTGGIAGYSASGSDMQYVGNYAYVTNTQRNANNNVAVGGVIGRFENKNVPGTTISYVDNHGLISGHSLTGGIIGRIKYQGVHILHCNNYGEINGNSNSSVGGIVGTVYGVVSGTQTISISSSNNYGAINGRNGGAIIGTSTANERGTRIIVTDCVNTGVLTGSVAGIMGTTDSGSSSLYRCRNYGLTNSTNYATNKLGLSASNSVMKDCFVFDNRSYGQSKNPDDNFYVYKTDGSVTEDGTDDNRIEIEDVTISDNYQESNDLLINTYDSSQTTRACLKSVNGGNVTAGNQLTLTYHFANREKLAGVGIQWFHNSETGAQTTARRYVYKLYYLNAGGQRVEIDSTYDSYNNRRTRVHTQEYGDVYVEVGYPLGMEEQSIYYHEIEGNGVNMASGIVIEVLEVRTLTTTDSARWDRNNGWSEEDAYSTSWGSLVQYVNIRSLLAANDDFGTVSQTNMPYTKAEGATSDTEFITQAGANALISKKNGTTYQLMSAAGVTTESSAALIGNTLTGIVTDPMGSLGAQTYYSDRSEYQDYENNALTDLSYRYKLIKEIEPKLMEYYQKKYTVDPSAIKINTPTVTDIGGAYRVNWTIANDSVEPYCYRMTYVVTDALGNEIERGSNDSVEKSQTVDIRNSWVGCTITFSVSGVYYELNNGVYTQRETEGKTVTIDKIAQVLPIPEVHLELVSTDATDNKNFVAVLDNQGDYAGIVCDIYYNSNHGTVRFAAADGKSKPFSLGNTAGNQTTYAQALAVDGDEQYSDSARRYLQTHVVPASALLANDYATSNFAGFYGNTPDSLYYRLSMKGTNDIEAYYYSEIVYYDAELGMDVAAGAGESHVTRDSATTATLSNLPASLLSGGSFTVRTYPWRTQSYLIYYGHEVRTSVTEEELSLKNITDDERNGQSIFTESGALKAGYVVRLKEEGDYQIIYSSILANDVSMQIDENTYTIDSSLHTITGNPDDTAVHNIQAVPEIGETTVSDTQNGKTGYLFDWDTGKSGGEYNNARYNIVLVGIASDGSRVVLETREDIAERSAFFEDSNWNYSKLSLTVTRVGNTDSSGKTTRFGTSSEKTYTIKLKLPTIAAPNITLHVANNRVEKNSLLYDVSWSGYRNADELDALDHYEVTVTGMNSGIGKVFHTTGAETNVVANLNEFDRGERVTINVRAIADTADTTYRDSATGVSRTITLPERLYAPEMTDKLSINYSYVADTSVSQDVFADGLTLNMTDAGTSETNGHYEIVAQIYDQRYSEAELSEVPAESMLATFGSKEAPLIFNGGLKQGSYTLHNTSGEYAGKWMRVVMRSASTNNISSVWTDEYVGDEYLTSVTPAVWFQLPRVEIADTTLSSESDSRTYTTMVDESASGSAPQQTTVTQNALSFTEQKYATDYVVQIGQKRSLGMVLGDVGSYQYLYDYLTIHKAFNGNWELYYASADDSRTIARYTADADYLGEYEYDSAKGADNSQYDPTRGTLIAVVDAAAVASTGAELELPYSQLVNEQSDVEGNLTGYAVTLNAYLNMTVENDKTTFRLTLPDTERLIISNVGYESAYRKTQCVNIWAVNATDDNYATTKVGRWYRSMNDYNVQEIKVDSVSILELKDETSPVLTYNSGTSADTGEEYVVYSQDYNAFRFQIISGEPDLYWYNFLVVMDDEDHPGQQKVYYYSGNGVNGTTSIASNLLLDDSFAGKTVTISAQALSGENQFSNWCNLGTYTLGSITGRQREAQLSAQKTTGKNSAKNKMAKSKLTDIKKSDDEIVIKEGDEDADVENTQRAESTESATSTERVTSTEEEATTE